MFGARPSALPAHLASFEFARLVVVLKERFAAAQEHPQPPERAGLPSGVWSGRARLELLRPESARGIWCTIAEVPGSPLEKCPAPLKLGGLALLARSH